MSEEADRIVDHYPDQCPNCLAALSSDLAAEVVGAYDRIDLPTISPFIERHQRLAVRCPVCDARVLAAVPEEASGSPFGPRLHGLATYLKTFQAFSYERLQAAFADVFGVRISQGALMNMLRRAQDCFVAGREQAVAELRQAKVVSSDETGVRIEGSNAYHWVFRCDQAVVHQAAPTRGAVVIRTMMDGHRPEVWCSDRYAAQQGHAPAHQTCLAHLARDVAYALDLSQDDVAFRLQLWLQKAFALAATSPPSPPPLPPSAAPWSGASTIDRRGIIAAASVYSVLEAARINVKLDRKHPLLTSSARQNPTNFLIGLIGKGRTTTLCRAKEHHYPN